MLCYLLFYVYQVSKKKKHLLNAIEKWLYYHVKYIVEYIMESERMREKRKRAEVYNILHCIETSYNNNEYRDLYLQRDK